mmetsp:Transcript_2781/g.5219  ORF Transcript_2781/g.5219 Transcript_2781/m.5219 type:complete len:100 (-) Transcript_2781:320-619(-)
MIGCCFLMIAIGEIIVVKSSGLAKRVTQKKVLQQLERRLVWVPMSGRLGWKNMQKITKNVDCVICTLGITLYIQQKNNKMSTMIWKARYSIDATKTSWL